MSRIRQWAPFLWIAALAFLFYGPSLKNGFAWDDHLVITRNAFVHDWTNFPLLFSSQYLTRLADFSALGSRFIGSGEATYRPFTTLSYFILYSTFGLSSAGYHLANLLLHITAAGWVFVFGKRLGLNPFTALFGALFFTVHPMVSEAVHCVSYNENMLCLIFLLWGLWAHVVKKNSLWAGLLFLLACFSKETGAIFFPLVMLYDLFFIFNHDPRRLAINKKIYSSYFFCLIFFLSVRFLIMRTPDSSLPALGGTFVTAFKAVALSWAWGIYPWLVQLTLPNDPAVMASRFFELRVLLSVFVLGLLVSSAFRWRKAVPAISFGILWFFAGMAPAFGMMMNNLAARYLYIAAPGFFWIISAGLEMGLRAARREAWRLPAYCVVLIYFAVPVIGSDRPWRDDLSLFKHFTELYPKNAMAHSELARRYFEKGAWESAVNEYQTALQIDPFWREDMLMLGVSYGMLERYPESLQVLKQALAADPASVVAWNALASTYANMGVYDEASRCWGRSLELSPGNSPARAGLEQLKSVDDRVII